VEERPFRAPVSRARAALWGPAQPQKSSLLGPRSAVEERPFRAAFSVAVGMGL
jgi:hypothetical protein